MELLDNNLYIEDIKKICEKDLPWGRLQDKSVLISGGNGLIGSFLVDVLMEKNIMSKLNCRIYVISRDSGKAKERFKRYLGDKNFEIIVCDINKKIDFEEVENVHYIVHLASNTHPKAYALNPIDTISTNVIGTNNLLEYGSRQSIKRFVFASTCEIYGENRGDIEKFEENYCGYINCNTLRAGYPESKRCAEALCQAYISQKDMDIVITRFPRVYGATMLMTDTKASSQFIKNGIEKKDVVLKSEGLQYYSYIYVADAVSALLTVLLLGEKGEAYNIADDKSNIKLKELAEIVANYVGTNVVFELPDNIEKAGYSNSMKSLLDSRKLQGIGWKAGYNIKEGIERTIEILSKIN